MSGEIDEQEKEAKFNILFERARKGVLKFLNEKGGSLTLGEMHEHSLNTYFIQHQRFSKMMETYIRDNFINYDELTQVSKITEEGKKFIQK